MATLSACLLLLLSLHGVFAQVNPPWEAPSPSPNTAVAPGPGAEAVPGLAPSIGIASFVSNDTEGDAPAPAPVAGADGLMPEDAPAPAPFRGMPLRAPMESPYGAPLGSPKQAPGPHARMMPPHPPQQRFTTPPLKRKTSPPPPKGTISSVTASPPKPKSPPPEKAPVHVSSVDPPPSPVPGELPPTTFKLKQEEHMDCCLWKRACHEYKGECTRETLRECANGMESGLCAACQVCREQRSKIPPKDLIIEETPSKAPVAACFEGEGDTVYTLCQEVVYQCHVYTDSMGNCPPHLKALLGEDDY